MIDFIYLELIAECGFRNYFNLTNNSAFEIPHSAILNSLTTPLLPI